MIDIGQAFARCETAGCEEKLALRLVLRIGGTTGFKLVDPIGGAKWMMGADPNGFFACFCPKHPPPKIEVAPALTLAEKH